MAGRHVPLAAAPRLLPLGLLLGLGVAAASMLTHWVAALAATLATANRKGCLSSVATVVSSCCTVGCGPKRKSSVG